MEISMLKSKIHRAVITQAELNYVGSVTIDEDLMDAAGLYEYEHVHIVNVNSGSRIETYVIAGERGSGVICLNGAAARAGQKGDLVIIMSYANLTPEEIKQLHDVNFDENGRGFFHDKSDTKSPATFLGAHTSYWRSAKKFSKAVVKAYEDGYKNFYPEECQK